MIAMKMTEKKKPIHTIPEGVWGSSRTDERKQKTEKERLNDITTDFQGNGYPVSNSTKEKNI